MAKPFSKLAESISRIVKGLFGLLLIVPLVCMGGSMLRHLGQVPAGARSIAGWAVIGAWGYLGLHLLFYKPTGLFRAHHRLLSKLATWLFGGQVSTTTPKGGQKGKGRAQPGGEPAKGSTLLVLSPYLVPLYTVLVCLGGWLARRWLDPAAVQIASGLLVGASLTMHWVMTADDLQQDRDRFPLDVYLPALAIIGLVSLVVVISCLPLAAPGLSLPSIFTETLVQSRQTYAAVVRVLFL